MDQLNGKQSGIHIIYDKTNCVYKFNGTLMIRLFIIFFFVLSEWLSNVLSIQKWILSEPRQVLRVHGSIRKHDMKCILLKWELIKIVKNVASSLYYHDNKM